MGAYMYSSKLFPENLNDICPQLQHIEANIFSSLKYPRGLFFNQFRKKKNTGWAGETYHIKTVCQRTNIIIEISSRECVN